MPDYTSDDKFRFDDWVAFDDPVWDDPDFDPMLTEIQLREKHGYPPMIRVLIRDAESNNYYGVGQTPVKM